MALQTLKGGLFLPEPYNIDLGSTNFLIDAAGEKVAGVFQIPKSGTITHLGFSVGTVTTAETLKVGLETVNASGDPTGTQYGGSAVGTQASPASDWFYEVALGTPATATVGDTVAIVVQFNSTIGNLNILGIQSPSTRVGYPYIDHYTASWAKNSATQPTFSVKYNDGTYEYCGLLPIVLTSTTYNNGSTPDERALYFSLPFPSAAIGAWVHLDLDGAVDIVLYDSDGSTTIGSFSMVVAERAGTSRRWHYGRFTQGSVSLSANTAYRLSVKPTSVTSIILNEFTVLSNAMFDMLSLGSNGYLSTRTDAGAWTETNTQRPFVGLILNKFDDGVGGSGGMLVHSGMTGGMRG